LLTVLDSNSFPWKQVQEDGDDRGAMSQHLSDEEQRARFELALRDPVQLRALADYFDLLRKWAQEKELAEGAATLEKLVDDV
jgi:hypothetical protein